MRHGRRGTSASLCARIVIVAFVAIGNAPSRRPSEPEAQRKPTPERGKPQCQLSELVRTWIAALLTFCALSFLYKDKPYSTSSLKRSSVELSRLGSAPALFIRCFIRM